MNKLIFLLGVVALFICPSQSRAGSVLEHFAVSTENAYIYHFTETSMRLESGNKEYLVLLEPQETGNVIFSLSDIAFTASVRVMNLAFGVEITGYKDGKHVYPVISLDEKNSMVRLRENKVKFERIIGSIPVFFSSPVDSIKLRFSNSANLDCEQYLSIDDLRIIPDVASTTNPMLIDCEKHSIMIGMDGSSAIDKKERTAITKHLLQFIKRPTVPMDSNTICIMEYGSQARTLSESMETKALTKSLKVYKKNKPKKKDKTRGSNWASAFDIAIEKQPDIFIFITNSLSNRAESGAITFSAQYVDLIEKCNQMKANGTRLMFITSGLSQSGNTHSSLYAFLNEENTRELSAMDISSETSLKEIDLVTLQERSTFELIDLGTIFKCEETEEEVLTQGNLTSASDGKK